MLRACDAKIAALERESTLLDELFRVVLEELMTGRVAVGMGLAEDGELPPMGVRRQRMALLASCANSMRDRLLHQEEIERYFSHLRGTRDG